MISVITTVLLHTVCAQNAAACSVVNCFMSLGFGSRNDKWLIFGDSSETNGGPKFRLAIVMFLNR